MIKEGPATYRLYSIIMGIVLSILLVLVIMVATVSCRENDTKQELSYEIIEIEGMTCILLNRGETLSNKGGLTCNWDEWDHKR